MAGYFVPIPVLEYTAQTQLAKYPEFLSDEAGKMP